MVDLPQPGGPTNNTLCSLTDNLLSVFAILNLVRWVFSREIGLLSRDGNICSVLVELLISKCSSTYMNAVKLQKSLETLGLDKLVAPDVLRRTYHKLSLKVHPDKNPNNPQAASKFQSITEAYDYLCNLKADHPNPTEHVYTNVSNVVPLVITLRLTIAQVYRGVMEPIKVSRNIFLDGEEPRVETETMYIQVPAGSDTGEVLTFKRKGHVYQHKGKGDLRVVIEVLRDSSFVRRGLDLYFTQNVELKEALCGSSYDIRHPSGQVLEIRNKEGVVLNPQEEKTLRGYGMKRGAYVGDMFIRFKIRFPTRLSKHQIEVLKETL